ncbi:hypothetical protein [Cryptosporangium arvum]|uniref:hypothetical protein n=1 Tax=Cryptosporangium arvum TaxID=80871 RepID=UPI0004B75BC5|nr:hypothetical protein [Cryptosporangium arvum]
MNDARETLRREFGSAPGSFMATLYADRVWDREAFGRMERAMRTVCAAHADRDQLDRWLAEGFYYVSTWVPDHTAHSAFPRPEPVDYYDACVTRLQDLAAWFFHGWHVYREPHDWDDL